MDDDTARLEDGYFMITNELAEKFAKINLSHHESRVLWAIFRKTDGGSKKIDAISLSQIQEITGLSRGKISIAKGQLINKNIIKSTDYFDMEINENYKTWVIQPKNENHANKEIPDYYRDTRPGEWKEIKYDRHKYKGMCEICQVLVTWEDTRWLQNHHIVPKSYGGLHSKGSQIANYEKPNIARLCRRCHIEAHEEMEEWIVVNGDDMEQWHQFFMSKLTAIQTESLSCKETK